MLARSPLTASISARTIEPLAGSAAPVQFVYQNPFSSLDPRFTVHA